METDKSLQASLFSPFKRRFGPGRLASRLIEKIHLVFLDGAMVHAGLAMLRLAGSAREPDDDRFADQLVMLDEDAAGLLLHYADNDALRHKVRRMLAARAAWFASRAMILRPEAVVRIDDDLADFLAQHGDAPHACFFARTARDILRQRL
ncbi:hypothetical protein [Noviherbaspirillum soli]|uniref:hypothetical protein n=1 Tax=Noviherbaspirillum soli TaxID=1064518 RepID=UPI00188D9B5F|nr:hypothetical protein [Noviherbaspirillum soli]